MAGCSTPLPLVGPPTADPEADARLRESAQAHGLDAYRKLNDINVSYSGEWRPLVNRIQPEVVDAGFRGSSQERLMPRAGVVAQAYTGPKGRKQVVWQREGRGDGDGPGDVAVWFNGVRSADSDVRNAAALVAEGYGLFLLGPLWLVDRGLPSKTAGTEQVDGRACDVVDVWLSPGLGRVASDRVALCIDRTDRYVRRMRFTLEGFAKTRGAVAEVDTFEHERRFGVVVADALVRTDRASDRAAGARLAHHRPRRRSRLCGERRDRGHLPGRGGRPRDTALDQRRRELLGREGALHRRPREHAVEPRPDVRQAARRPREAARPAA